MTTGTEVAPHQLPRWITRPEFERWLTGFQPDAVVGYRCRASTCPVAKFISHRTQEVALVSNDEITIGPTMLALREGQGRHYAPPDWVGDFLELVDERGDPAEGVEAAEALLLLDSLS